VAPLQDEVTALHHWLPVAFAVFVWWSTTTLALYLDGLPSRTFRRSIGFASVLLVAAFIAISQSSHVTSSAAAYLAFTSGLVVWGWNEIAFLTGLITGPRRTACAPACGGWKHFLHGVEALLYHELVIGVCGSLVFALSWNEANDVASKTFLTLWLMRISAKLNIFLGVRNLGTELLPPHLEYLQSFFSRKPLNLLFPVSVTVATAVAVHLFAQANAASASAFEVTGATLVGTMLALGLMEHWLLVLPIETNSLWSYGLQSRTRDPRESQPNA